MILVLLLALGDCSGGGVARAFRHELVQHAYRTQRQRRSVETPPIGDLTFNTTYLTDEHVHTVGLAYKFFVMVYTGESVDIHVQGSPLKVPSDSGWLLGTASETTITLYTRSIPSADGLLLVTLHEMFHVFGFSTAHEAGALSFIERSNPFTLEYNSVPMQLCTGDNVHVHRDQAHWNKSNAYFQDDIMLPYIDFSKSATSVCTVKAVLESRPSWSHHMCSADTECTGGDVCRRIGRHWFSVCHAPGTVVSRVFSPDDVITNTLTYALAIYILTTVIPAGVKQPTGQYSV